MPALLRFFAIAASIVVGVAFAIFAVEEMKRGSEGQRQAIDEATGRSAYVAPPAPTPDEEVARERRHGTVREAIDDANDVLVMPFSQVVAGSKSNWVTHGVPALLALLVYGFGLSLLANLLPQAKTHSGDWRTAES